MPHSATMVSMNFKKEYFKGVEDLAEGFADDNPLAGSASYEIYLKDIDMQDDMVAWLGTVQGIRKINSPMPPRQKHTLLP